MKNKLTKKEQLERVLKDSQFGRYKGTPENQFTHNRLPVKAIMGRDNGGANVMIEGKESTMFDNPNTLAKYLDKNEIYAKGGEIKMWNGDKIHALANSLTELEKHKLLLTLNEKETEKFNTLIQLGDSVNLALISTLVEESPQTRLSWLKRQKKSGVSSKSMAKGGNVGNDKHTLIVDNGRYGLQNWYLEKIDSTHFYMSNDKDFRGMAHHIGQHRGEPYYEEVKQWLKDTMAKGGKTKVKNYIDTSEEAKAKFKERLRIQADKQGETYSEEQIESMYQQYRINENNNNLPYAKGGVTKKFPIAVKRRIDEINNLLPKVEDASDIAGGYFGSTMYSYVQLTKPIEIKNNYVYIHTPKTSTYQSNNYPFEKRYNVNNKDEYDANGLKGLKQDLGIILKAFKQLLRDEGVTFAKGGRTASATNRDRKYYNSSQSWEKPTDSKGRKRPTYKKRSLDKGGDIKVGDKYYSYENPDKLYEINYIRGEGDYKTYKISLRTKEGYSYSSKNLSKGSLSKTSRKSDALKVKKGKMTKSSFKDKWGSEMYLDKYQRGGDVMSLGIANADAVLKDGGQIEMKL